MTPRPPGRPRSPPRCSYRCGWGGVPGAPSPQRGGPVSYRCVLAPHAEGDHAIEIDGVRLARERLGRGEYERPERSDQRTEVVSFRVTEQVHAALVVEARARGDGSAALAAQAVVERWATETTKAPPP